MATRGEAFLVSSTCRRGSSACIAHKREQTLAAIGDESLECGAQRISGAIRFEAALEVKGLRQIERRKLRAKLGLALRPAGGVAVAGIDRPRERLDQLRLDLGPKRAERYVEHLIGGDDAFNGRWRAPDLRYRLVLDDGEIGDSALLWNDGMKFRRENVRHAVRIGGSHARLRGTTPGRKRSGLRLYRPTQPAVRSVDTSHMGDGRTKKPDPAAQATTKHHVDQQYDRSSVFQQASSSIGEYAHEKYVDEFEGGWETLRGETAASSFDAGHGTAQRLSGKSNGEGGFGDLLAAATVDAVAAHEQEWGVIATAVAPVTKALEAGIAAQHAYIEVAHKGDPEWVQDRRAYSNAWAQDNIESMQRYQWEQGKSCTAYNNWCPIANASHLAMAEITEGAGILGFKLDSQQDTVAFIKAIEASLDAACELADAKVLGDHHGASWANRNEDPSWRSNAQPELHGTELAPQLEELRSAYADLDNAYNGVYEGLLADREKALASDAAGVSAQIQEIENVVSFWTGLAGSVAGGVSNLNTAMSVGHKIERHYESGAAAGNAATRDAMKAAHRAEKDETDVHSGLEAVAKGHQAENNQEYWNGGKASKRADRQPLAPPVHGPTQIPSFSVGGFVDLAMKLWSDDKLSALKHKLEAIEDEARATHATIQMIQSRAALERFNNAKRRVAELVKNVGQHQFALRQQELANVGHDLDRYATEHRSELAAHRSAFRAPGGGLELFGTVMSLMGKIEQYRALSTLALGCFGYDTFIDAARIQQLERARVKRPAESAARNPGAAYDPPPPVALMTAEETNVYQQIGGAYLLVSQQDAHWQVRLAQITPRFDALMKKLTGRDHVPRTEGKRF